jgi:hypothetical protein
MDGQTTTLLSSGLRESTCLRPSLPTNLMPGLLFWMDMEVMQRCVFLFIYQRINADLKQDEWIVTCFLNNVYCCYLPAHCSHGLQPLDNGVFNASKAAYRKELEKLASLTDSAPVDKVNFIRAYAKAREVAMTSKNILSGWRVTGNWPISRAKALRHQRFKQTG